MAVENKIFGKRIKELRESKGLTQGGLAEIFQAKKTLISNWETHVSTPSFADFCAVADFFQVSLDYLAGRTDNPKVSRGRKKDPDQG